MYIFPEMIQLGLSDGQRWPSPAHKKVAQTVCLCNPRVRSRDTLQNMVEKINAIPKDKIKLVTLGDLARVYKVPCISLS